MRHEDLRPALYHRLHRLVPVIAHPTVRRIGRFALRGLLVLYFAFVVLILTLRYLVLPNIETYRPEIERQVSQAIGLSVAIGRVAASWDGINPDLTLADVQIADAQGQPALAFNRVECILSWSSLAALQLRLRLLQIDEPTLHLRRDVDGRFFVAGIAVGGQEEDSGVADWVLAQKRIRINGATVVWEDARRNAPALILEDVNLAVDNDGRQHRFGLTALPPAALASQLDVRGDFRGKAFAHLVAWKGQAFAQIDSTDLAAWRTWLDYPLALPHGRGGVRAWVSFADGSLQELTADLSLNDVHLRLAKDLPSIEVAQLSGRIGAHLSPAAMRVEGSRVEIVTRALGGAGDAAAPGIHLGPTDFILEWQPQLADSRSLRGSGSASTLDLGALAALAAHVPLDAGSRQLLDDFAPRGQISELRASWQTNAEVLQAYSLKGRFDHLTFRPRGQLPGASGLSGSLEANEQGGKVQLRSQQVKIDLPDVIPESAIAFDTLNAQAKWKTNQGNLEAELLRAEFSGPDAVGSAKGTYHHGGEGPGSIDLTAALTHADARAVWRYLPAAINSDARYWVRDALKAGTASEVRLILKGDLAKFPFLDRKQGQFLVTVKAQGVTLDYATGWPEITGLDADLRFEGNGMVVQARRGSILGATLAEARAEIPDFDAPVSTLKVKGRAEGETAEFLKYIEQSPVADQIDRFTANMSASGKGRLDIALVIPLEEARLGESRIEGHYTFLANDVIVDPALPPLRQVKGSLQFSEKDLRVPEINALLFGGPVRIKGGTRDGKVLVVADGTLLIDDLRQRLESPLLDHLSGSTAYHAEVRVRKRDVELVLDSNLVGVASTLPAPLGKSASDALPVHFENALLPPSAARGGQPVVRDQLRATLGNVLSLQLIRRKQGADAYPERGVIMIGRPLAPLPERGVSVGITVRSFDLDYWQKLFASGGEKGGDGSPADFPVALDLKADELLLLNGRYTAVGVGLAGATSRWRGTVESDQAVGSFLWDGSGAGKLKALFKKWRRPEEVSRDVEPGEAIKELPALDIVVDDFVVGDHRFGRLEVQAHNDGAVWRLDKIDLRNPFGNLSGSGQWQVSAANRTQLDFSLASSDVGSLLDRLGYGGAVRGGSATMVGKIGWNESPAALDYATLSGEMTFEASKGRFLKLDPGAGKLLGLLSLQGLARRFSLDFGDVFSEGFAFDNISSKLTVTSGLMRTERLQIDSPSARVVMRGEADLKNETQRLDVTVQPELGGSAAIGVAVINPLAGVATLLADKILQGPLSKVFSLEYRVTGKWDDPKVEKISGSAGAAATP